MPTPNLGTSINDPGITGAKRMSWKRSNPFAVLLRIITDNPDMDREEIRAECWDILHRNQEQMRTVFDYWLDNNYHRLVKPKATPVKRTTPRPIPASIVPVDTITAAIDKKFTEQVRRLLLDMVLPGGEARDWAREELLEFGGTSDRFTQCLAARLAPGQSIAQAGLPNAEIEELYEAAV